MPWHPPLPGQVRAPFIAAAVLPLEQCAGRARLAPLLTLAPAASPWCSLTHAHAQPPSPPPFTRTGVLYMLISIVSICYWMQGNALRQEYEEKELEETSLLSKSRGGGDGEEEGRKRDGEEEDWGDAPKLQ